MIVDEQIIDYLRRHPLGRRASRIQLDLPEWIDSNELRAAFRRLRKAGTITFYTLDGFPMFGYARLTAFPAGDHEIPVTFPDDR